MTSALIDAGLAGAIGRQFASSGPEVSRSTARDAVVMLRDLAAEAQEHVAAVTGIAAPSDNAVFVIDRREWIDANVSSLADLLHSWTPRKKPSAFARSIGSRALAIEVGVALSWLSTKVLGQYEVFTPSELSGRLLLVAPNIVEVEQTLEVNPRDFRLWVCLHEEAHRVQFAAHPWLGEYLRALTISFLEISDVPPQQLLRQLTRAASKDDSSGDFERSWFERMMNAEQRELFDRVTAVMSLLEGHADVVMDEVGPHVVGSVAQIRSRFQERRTNPSTLDRMVRSALGMDAKMRQYADGAVFVRRVVDEIGMQGFNQVWQSAGNLPTRIELHDPQLWIDRVASGVAA